MIADHPSLRKAVAAPRTLGRQGPLAMLLRWKLALRQKRHLGRLSGQMLRDIGLTERTRDALSVADIAKGVRI